ncbi:hypothetical protein GBAR_LOCUS12346 [Geodia barretti]|uniref:Uncharacterized protein n=1 Tax=Geodia barretti TaxID=519541 RepID=A0AA35WGJ9_GEOBA|nr:hypothetical protein GBAR_LOCUS12346 [Geodia barretti]
MDVSCWLLSLLTLIVAVQCRALALPVTNHEESHSQYKRTPSSFSSSSSASSSVPAVASTGSNSQLCQFSQGSCHFYSHCIESNFHCGPTGFTQAYAKSRCEIIDQLRNVDDESCEHCIGNRAIYEWAVHQDSCLKQKLQSLVERDYATEHSDPPTCLELEKDGLKLMEECSREQSGDFCSSLAGSNHGAIQRDIEKIARHMRINAYYATQVERMLNNLILNCGQEDHIATIANSVLSEGFHSQRLVFCTVILSYLTEIINSTYAMRMVAQHLDRPEDQFRVSGYDESRRCVSNYRYPAEITPAANDKLLFVTWSPEPNDDLVETIQGTGRGYVEQDTTEDDSHIDIFFYRYTPLQSSEDFPECGDGMRQAGEICDMGVGNIEADPDNEDTMGCSLTCVPVHTRVECSTGQFATSECWLVVCGDGVRSASEECDVGSDAAGSGCSSCSRDPEYTCTTTYNSTSVCTHVSTTTQTTLYPPATTSPPSKLPTSTSSSVSHHSLSSTSSSAAPPHSPRSPISPHLTNPPTVGQLHSSSQASTHLRWRNMAFQCLVSILLSWTAVHLLIAR